eukprot:scaffold5359_cov131-Isochrysis_galbana.AAC.4
MSLPSGSPAGEPAGEPKPSVRESCFGIARVSAPASASETTVRVGCRAEASGCEQRWPTPLTWSPWLSSALVCDGKGPELINRPERLGAECGLRVRRGDDWAGNRGRLESASGLACCRSNTGSLPQSSMASS